MWCVSFHIHTINIYDNACVSISGVLFTFQFMCFIVDYHLVCLRFVFSSSFSRFHILSRVHCFNGALGGSVGASTWGISFMKCYCDTLHGKYPIFTILFDSIGSMLCGNLIILVLYYMLISFALI